MVEMMRRRRSVAVSQSLVVRRVLLAAAVSTSVSPSQLKRRWVARVNPPHSLLLLPEMFRVL